MGILVIAVLNLFPRHEILDLVDLLLVKIAFGLHLLNLLDSLLLVRRDFEFLFVAPQYVWLGLDSSFRQHIMQIDNLV